MCTVRCFTAKAVAFPASSENTTRLNRIGSKCSTQSTDSPGLSRGKESALHVEFVDLIKSAVTEIDLHVALVNAVERTVFMTMRMTKMTRGMTSEALGILGAYILIRIEDLRSRI